MSIRDVARHERFHDRVRYLAVKTALAVAAESEATTSHAARLALCGRLFLGVIATEQLVELVLANSTIAAAAQSDQHGDGRSIPNDDIESQLAAVWTPLALALAEN